MEYFSSWYPWPLAWKPVASHGYVCGRGRNSYSCNLFKVSLTHFFQIDLQPTGLLRQECVYLTIFYRMGHVFTWKIIEITRWSDRNACMIFDPTWIVIEYLFKNMTGITAITISKYNNSHVAIKIFRLIHSYIIM